MSSRLRLHLRHFSLRECGHSACLRCIAQKCATLLENQFNKQAGALVAIYENVPLPATHQDLLDRFEYYCDMQSQLSDLIYACPSCSEEIQSRPLSQAILESLLACHAGLKTRLAALGVDGFEGRAAAEVEDEPLYDNGYCLDMLRLAERNVKDRRMFASNVAYVTALREREHARWASFYAQM